MSGQEAELIFEGKKETFSLTREKLIARMLLSVQWYDLLDVFGAKEVKSFLSDDILSNIRFKDVRENFIYARAGLNER